MTRREHKLPNLVPLDVLVFYLPRALLLIERNQNPTTLTYELEQIGVRRVAQNIAESGFGLFNLPVCSVTGAMMEGMRVKGKVGCHKGLWISGERRAYPYGRLCRNFHFLAKAAVIVDFLAVSVR